MLSHLVSYSGPVQAISGINEKVAALPTHSTELTMQIHQCKNSHTKHVRFKSEIQSPFPRP